MGFYLIFRTWSSGLRRGWSNPSGDSAQSNSANYRSGRSADPGNVSTGKRDLHSSLSGVLLTCTRLKYWGVTKQTVQILALRVYNKSNLKQKYHCIKVLIPPAL